MITAQSQEDNAGTCLDRFIREFHKLSVTQECQS